MINSPIFVDTSAWFACIVTTDKNHSSASRWLEINTRPLLTTDYIVDETLTLLKLRREFDRALELGTAFFGGSLATVYRLTEEDVREAWRTFHDFRDKDWSFTDCTSRVVLRKLGIEDAFVFDHHFDQFGIVRSLP